MSKQKTTIGNVRFDPPLPNDLETRTPQRALEIAREVMR